MSSKYLVIVESPAKIKTISKFLGQAYTLKASFGHVRDLPSKKLGIDVEKDFVPSYETMGDKKKVIQELKPLATKAEIVFLAMDPDREGEAIAWHLEQALKLPKEKVKRVVFNEITKPAITKAFDSLKDINVDLVNAQQARRVLDRLVGFEVSPVLWRKVKTGLSAGRVQSVAVRLIVERENEIKAFDSQSNFRVKGEFLSHQDQPFQALIPKDFKDLKGAKSFLESCIGKQFFVKDIQKKASKRSPSAPFTTSSLQQEASRKLRFTVSKTMQVAQKLYEAGHITYMRTDSVALSDTAVSGAKKCILAMYGEKYSSPKKFASKAKGAQEAHEAIRPAYFDKVEAGTNQDEKRLYTLIRQRALASQMSSAELEKTQVDIHAEGLNHDFVANGEVIVFDGFLKAYEQSKDEDDEGSASSVEKGFLPKFNKNEEVFVKQLEAKERFSRPPARYSEASLVKKLEELGIGRPSTYAPTISTIQKREYVNMAFLEGKKRSLRILTLEASSVTESTIEETYGADKAKLMPTDIGFVVNRFLEQHFTDIMDYHFTANIEEQLDQIAQGDLAWQKMIKSFYQPFHEIVLKTTDGAARESGERILGKDPKTGEDVLVRLGRYGPLVQIGRSDDESKKPRFASLLRDQTLDTITLDEALDLFKFPRKLGDYEGESVTAAIGRYGPYIKFKNKFVSLKEHDAALVTLDEAIELIKEKIEQEKSAIIKEFLDQDPPIRVLNGRYGPYICQGDKKKKNFKIPKDKEAEKLTLEDCLNIVDTASPATKARRKKKT